MKNETDWKLNQSMSPAFSIAFQGYIDLHCTWKHLRDMSGKLTTWKMERFGFPLISRKRFHVQRRSIYPWKALEKAGDIGWFDFQSIPFFTVKHVENGTSKTLHVPFSTLLTMKNETDWKLNQSMSLAFSIAFQGYIDLRCTWKLSRDIGEKRNTRKMEHFSFPFTSRERFHVQRRSIYPWKGR